MWAGLVGSQVKACGFRPKYWLAVLICHVLSWHTVGNTHSCQSKELDITTKASDAHSPLLQDSLSSP